MIKQVDASRSKCLLQPGTPANQSQAMFENTNPTS